MKSINNRFIDHPAKKNDKGVSVSVLCPYQKEMSMQKVVHLL